MDEKMKVLFIHNAVPEYRIEFWKKLAQKVELKILITQKGLEDQIYGLNKNTETLDIVYWDESWIKKVCEYNVVIVPPIESLKEYKIANVIAYKCKKNKITCLYWNERWEWKGEINSLKRNLSRWGHRKLIKKVCDECNGVIASGTKAKEYLEGLNVAYKVAIAYDSSTSPKAIDKIDFVRKYGISDKDKVILYLGRVVKRKGLYNLLKSYKMIKSNAWLIVGGDGEDYQRCYEYVENNKLDKVIFIGKVQPEIRSEYFKRADVFVLSSLLIEAWGLTVNEALEQGTPVIVTDACGVAYDLADGINCIKIESGNNIQLADILSKVLKESKNEVACKQLYQRFSVSNMVDSFYEVISKQ